MLVATKGGHLRPGDGSWTQDGSPAYLKEAAKASAKRLGVEAIGLYQFHRPDPKVPFADSVGAIRDLLDEGDHPMAGISNATVEQIDQADEILGGRLVSVQNQFSPRSAPASASSSMRRARHRVPAVEPAGRHRAVGRAGRSAPGLRAGRADAHGVSSSR